MAEKKGSKKTQTKAGMLREKGSRAANQKNETKPAKKPENTPKISKNEAEGNHDDKPLH